MPTKKEGLKKKYYQENADQIKAAARAKYQAEPQRELP